VIEQASGQILHVAQAVGNEHDVTLARQHPEAFPPGSLCLGDLGYQGLEIEGCRVLLPFKKPRLRELEPEQVAFNRVFAHFRVKVEHCIRLLKIFRIVKERYRNRRRRFGIRLQLITGCVNWMSMAIYFDPPLANKIDPPDALVC